MKNAHEPNILVITSIHGYCIFLHYRGLIIINILTRENLIPNALQAGENFHLTHFEIFFLFFPENMR